MEKIRLVIASDHGGFNLKNVILNYLLESGYTVEDLGCYDTNSCDYPFYAKKLCEKIINNEADKGILVCGTGQGMAIAANKFKNIRAVCVTDTFSAKMTVEHNNANVLTLGERVLGFGLAKEIIDAWLSAEFQGGRHKKRIDMLEQ